MKKKIYDVLFEKRICGRTKQKTIFVTRSVSFKCFSIRAKERQQQKQFECVDSSVMHNLLLPLTSENNDTIYQPTIVKHEKILPSSPVLKTRKEISTIRKSIVERRDEVDERTTTFKNSIISARQ